MKIQETVCQKFGGSNSKDFSICHHSIFLNLLLNFVCFLLRSEGIRGFFRGVGPNALKVAPSAAITFVVYEETMKIFRAW
jgi:hypothetical protein